MFLVSVCKGPTCLTNVLHCASKLVTLKSIDNISLVGDAVLILTGHYNWSHLHLYITSPLLVMLSLSLGPPTDPSLYCYP